MPARPAGSRRRPVERRRASRATRRTSRASPRAPHQRTAVVVSGAGHGQQHDAAGERQERDDRQQVKPFTRPPHQEPRTPTAPARNAERVGAHEAGLHAAGHPGAAACPAADRVHRAVDDPRSTTTRRSRRARPSPAVAQDACVRVVDVPAVARTGAWLEPRRGRRCQSSAARPVDEPGQPRSRTRVTRPRSRRAPRPRGPAVPSSATPTHRVAARPRFALGRRAQQPRERRRRGEHAQRDPA